MDYPNFDKYWLGLNEAEEAGTNTVNPTDPYEYKREGEEGNWTYYTRKKGATDWLQIVKDEMVKSIETQVQFKAAEGSTAATEEFLTGDTAIARLNVARPEWAKVLISEYPFATVDPYSNQFFDDKGKMRYSEDVLGKTMFNYSQDDDANFSTGVDWDPAKKPAHVLDNPLYKGVASTTPAPTPTPEPAPATTPPTTTPVPETPADPKQQVSQLRQEIKDTRQELRSAKKDARLEKKLDRLDKRKERLEGKLANESKVYSFNQFVKLKNKF
jgi:hypothetical protein